MISANPPDLFYQINATELASRLSDVTLVDLRPAEVLGSGSDQRSALIPRNNSDGNGHPDGLVACF